LRLARLLRMDVPDDIVAAALEARKGASRSGMGVDVVRAALRAHSKSSVNLAMLARDLGCCVETLHSFLKQRAVPRPDVLRGLTRILFHGHVELEGDVLRPAYREPAKALASRPVPAR
jgi:hypothetical protein